MSLIQLDDLTRRYGRRRGVERVSLSVPAGALFGFLGPNGAGKTTTIRVMLGFLRPTSGQARIFGLDCWRDSRMIKRDNVLGNGAWPWRDMGVLLVSGGAMWLMGGMMFARRDLCTV